MGSDLAPTFETYLSVRLYAESLRALLSKHGLQPKMVHLSVKSMLTRRQGIAGTIEKAAAR